jgi:tyrosyl-tRNA synthetase
MPTRQVSLSTLGSRVPVVDLLVASGLATSKADARRGILGKGFYLNDQPIEAADLLLGDEQLQGPPESRFVILRKGKRNYVRLVLLP